MGSSLITAAQAAEYRAAISDIFWTFARPFSLYLDAQTAVVSTSLTYSRFGQHDQNTPVDADNPAVTPTVYTVTGCITYGNRQPWLDFSPDGSKAVQQLKLKESDGIVRIKVEEQGYNLFKQAKLVELDGFMFQLNSNARPHGVVGEPDRWSFTLEKVD